MRNVFSFLMLVAATGSWAQISPPGLGKTNLSLWTALGVRQALDTANRMQSVTYIGYGQISHPDNYNPVQKPGILIINEEFYHQFNTHLQYSAALSYRNQREYTDTFPYQPDIPAYRHEFRVYSRFSFIDKNERSRLTYTFRQEFRKFFTPDFQNWDESFQLRSRLRFQYLAYLSGNKVHRLSFSAEALFAISRSIAPVKDWGPFRYRETRISLYYSFNPENIPFVFNIGYMSNFIGTGNVHVGHYLAIDLIWENPFGWMVAGKESSGGMQ
jgi:hypothetical protein